MVAESIFDKYSLIFYYMLHNSASLQLNMIVDLNSSIAFARDLQDFAKTGMTTKMDFVCNFVAITCTAIST